MLTHNHYSLHTTNELIKKIGCGLHGMKYTFKYDIIIIISGDILFLLNGCVFLF